MRTPAAPAPGYTLVETICVVSILGILLAIAAPSVAGWRDRAAVHAARDELAGAVAWTRMVAVARGGAALVVEPGTGRVWTEDGQGPVRPPVGLAGRYRVRIDAGSDAPVRVPFDALGIGRLGSRTVAVRRGGATAGITISAYGRVRRW